MRVAITGAGGQLGRALQTALGEHTLLPLTREELDVSDLSSVLQAMGGFGPDVIVHAAAYTKVDDCESNREHAFRVNALGTRNVAVAAARAGASLAYISTNYVFDGSAPEPYHEWAPPRPISVYGASKLGGEEAARTLAGGRFYIIRTGWLYDEGGRNFVGTMLRLASERLVLKVIDDQHGQPTSVHDLAGAIAALVTLPAYGVYHLTNSGACSRYEWVVELLRLAGRRDVAVEPIPTSAFPRPAAAPPNGVLANWAGAAVGITVRSWQEGLADVVARMPAQT